MSFARRRIFSLFFLFLFGIASGCGQVNHVRQVAAPEGADESIETEKQPVEDQYFVHTVKQKGENLYRISYWYTGSGKNWKSIAAANPSLNSRKINIGASIVIPEELIKNREPMPDGYRAPVANELERPLDSTLQVTAKPVENELFGPIDNNVQPVFDELGDSPLPLESLE